MNRASLRDALCCSLWGALLFSWLMLWTCAGAASTRPVLLVRESTDAVDPELWETVEALLENAGIVLVSDTELDDAHAVHVSVEETPTGVAIIAQDPAAPSRHVRREVQRTASAGVYRETIAQVLLSMVEPLSEEHAPAPREDDANILTLPMPGPEDAAPVEPSAEAGWVLSLAARGGAGLITAGSVRPTLGGQLGLRFARTWLRPSLALEGLWIAPHEERSLALRGRVRGAQLRVVGAAELANKGRFALDLGVGAGFDFLAMNVKGAMSPLVARPPSRRLQPVLSLRVVPRLWLSQALSLSAGAAVDLDLAPRRWVVEGRGRQVTLLETPRLRPQAVVALEWACCVLTSAPRETAL